MMTKTNLIAAAMIAAATFAAAPASNATVAAGQMAANAATAAQTTAAMAQSASGNVAVEPVAGNVHLAGGKFKKHHHRHGHFGHRFHGYGFYDPIYFDDGCHWLKRKWHRTGRYYWKKRYFRCISGYY